MSISFAFEESISCLNHKFIKNIINFLTSLHCPPKETSIWCSCWDEKFVRLWRYFNDTSGNCWWSYRQDSACPWYIGLYGQEWSQFPVATNLTKWMGHRRLQAFLTVPAIYLFHGGKKASRSHRRISWSIINLPLNLIMDNLQPRSNTTRYKHNGKFKIPPFGLII